MKFTSIDSNVEKTPVLDSRSYQPFINSRFVYYTSQISLHGAVGLLLYNVWSGPYTFFIWHPTFNTLTFYFLCQGILSTQHTENSHERAIGLKSHIWYNSLALISMFSAVAVIVTHKWSHNLEHFQIAHSKIGLAIGILAPTVALAGAAMVYYPSIFGGRGKAKGFYHHHRLGGYLSLGLISLNATLGLFTNWGFKNIQNQGLMIGLLIASVGSLFSRMDYRKLRFY